MMNLGYVEATQGDFVARVYYDATLPPSADQPLIDGEGGYCLEITGDGHIVIEGMTFDRSVTVRDLGALGITTRGHAGSLQIVGPG